MKQIVFFIASIAFNLLKVFPVKKRRIIMECDYGKGFYGNLLYIYNEMQREKLDYEIIIPVNKNVEINQVKLGENTKVVKTKGFMHMFYLATSSMWITNNHYYFFLRKRKNTLMINTWHAMGVFKTFAMDSAKSQQEREKYIMDSKNIDYLLVSSDKVKDIYSKALNIPEQKILDMGVPRTDPLFDKEYIRKERLNFEDENPCLKGRKLILYAPTFRDDEKEYFNMQLDLREMKRRLGTEYGVILKIHPIIRHPFKIEEELKDFVYDFSKHNINDLMISSDMLITDYSSVIFEYALLEKPMFFYAYDYHKYKENIRGFYFDYEEFIPGKRLNTTEEVIEEIEKVEDKNYDMENIRKFAKEFCHYTDGKSSERFVNRFLK
ncbi:CDP-glycerol glycerophosphotransferase, TagB/SpsB family [Hathewaya proteolytica DSM 3090]|uniref:CDP-glycerol glycerophosphotransferase, TagB/SpsB family n=1 Tax=Hathewaya proteolytica DSM 3090 TaxID=1121331 RepID=A0A1M6PT33_9CLOT|nr:CDP-glycerol glycerophosphotransferase family protein [Hathewaya proteolytica]SHK11113.1 CDP-glycerol glycerophosphotransferase, TagB/SpsB family [Hathewaya proteolytica DSM 3090]